MIWLRFQRFRLVTPVQIIGCLENYTNSILGQERGSIYLFEVIRQFSMSNRSKSWIWVQFWPRLLGQSQLSNASDLPCYFQNFGFFPEATHLIGYTPRNRCFVWGETKIKRIGWILDQLNDLDLWPHPSSWRWISLEISVSHELLVWFMWSEKKANQLATLGYKYVTLPFDHTIILALNFQCQKFK